LPKAQSTQVFGAVKVFGYAALLHVVQSTLKQVGRHSAQPLVPKPQGVDDDGTQRFMNGQQNIPSWHCSDDTQLPHCCTNLVFPPQSAADELLGVEGATFVGAGTAGVGALPHFPQDFGQYFATIAPICALLQKPASCEHCADTPLSLIGKFVWSMHAVAGVGGVTGATGLTGVSVTGGGATGALLGTRVGARVAGLKEPPQHSKPAVNEFSGCLPIAYALNIPPLALHAASFPASTGVTPAGVLGASAHAHPLEGVTGATGVRVTAGGATGALEGTRVGAAVAGVTGVPVDGATGTRVGVAVAGTGTRVGVAVAGTDGVTAGGVGVAQVASGQRFVAPASGRLPPERHLRLES